jgi:tetratricopeptide (TPR) repeat protein
MGSRAEGCFELYHQELDISGCQEYARLRSERVPRHDGHLELRAVREHLACESGPCGHVDQCSSRVRRPNAYQDRIAWRRADRDTIPAMSFRLLAVGGVLCAGILMSVSAHQTAQPNASQLPLTPEAKSLLGRALQEHRYDDAETLLVQKTQKKPEVRELLTFLGEVFFLDHKFLNCAVAMSKADKLAPLGSDHRFTLALAYLAMKRPDWARPELDTLHRANPKNSLYVYWLGKLDFEDQQLPAAIEKFKEAIRLDPGSVKANDMLGVSNEVAGKNDEAVSYFEQAVRLNRRAVPPSAWPPLDYGSMLLKASKVPEAVPYLREAVRYEPKLAKAHYRLGCLLELQKKGDEAIAELKLAAALDPVDAEPWYALARIYRREGRKDEAANAASEFQKRLKNNTGTAPGAPGR